MLNEREGEVKSRTLNRNDELKKKERRREIESLKKNVKVVGLA